MVLCQVEARPSPAIAHSHDKHFMTMVLTGRASEIDDRKRSRPQSPGGFVLIPAGMNHAHQVESEKVDVFGAIFCPATLGLEESFVLGDPHMATAGAATDAVRRLHREFCREDVSSLALKGLFYEFIAELARTNDVPASVPDWVVQARDFLLDNRAKHIEVNEVADAVAVHPSHLCRTFRRHYGETPGAFLREARLQLAYEMARSGRRPLSEVAAKCGFADQAHLAKAFKARFGVRPSDLRKGP